MCGFNFTSLVCHRSITPMQEISRYLIIFRSLQDTVQYKLIGSEEGLLSNKEIVRKLEKERLKATTIKDENLLKKLLP